MDEFVSERRKAVSLKRSKSVRASLRSIGTKLLIGKSNNNVMEKTPSMGSLVEYRDLKSSYYIRETCTHQTVETILKTPMPKHKAHAKQKKKLADFHTTTPPSTIAPKAAQLLQIPLKENCEPVNLRQNFHAVDFDYRHGGFQRTSLRLSMTTKRKQERNSAIYSSTTGTYR